MNIDDIKTNAEIGEQLRKYRTSCGYRLQDAARVVGKTVAAVSNWEHGRRSPDPDSFIKLLQFYEVMDFNDFKIIYTEKTTMSLSQDEIELINKWRRLTPEKKAAFLCFLGD